MSLDAAPVAPTALENVPIIDLAQPEPAIAKLIGKACRDWGFFQIVNHDFDPMLIAAVSRASASLFQSSTELKRQCLRSRENPWGYYDRELTKNERDKKEIFDMGPQIDEGLELAGGTPWPKWLPQFEAVMKPYFVECEALARRILSLIALSLNAKADALDAYFAPASTSFLRLNFYPTLDTVAKDGEKAAALGIHHHTDAGALTILRQDEVPGLQVFHQKLWHTIEPRSDALVINVGDLVQVWSNDAYLAPLHRVLGMDTRSRSSIAFFYNPAYQAQISPLNDVLGHAGQAKYRTFRWGDFRKARADGDFADYGAEIQINDYRVVDQ